MINLPEEKRKYEKVIETKMNQEIERVKIEYEGKIAQAKKRVQEIRLAGSKIQATQENCEALEKKLSNKKRAVETGKNEIENARTNRLKTVAVLEKMKDENNELRNKIEKLEERKKEMMLSAVKRKEQGGEGKELTNRLESAQDLNDELMEDNVNLVVEFENRCRDLVEYFSSGIQGYKICKLGCRIFVWIDQRWRI